MSSFALTVVNPSTKGMEPARSAAAESSHTPAARKVAWNDDEICPFAVGEPTEYAAQALKLGLAEIGFSEHNPMIRDDYDDWHMFQNDLDTYVEKVKKARRDHPTLVIKLAP